MPSRISWATLALLALWSCTSAPPISSPPKESSGKQDRATNAVTMIDEKKGTAAPRAPIVIPGSGRLIGSPPVPKRDSAESKDGFQLNFLNTDIAEIIGTVLGEGLGVPYVVDPQVKGTMTLQATRPLSKAEVLVALETALRTQGIALVEGNGVYYVIPSKDAVRHVTSLRMSADGAHGYGIYVVPLQYVAAAEMEKIIRPFAPEGGVLRVDEARNLLLLAGSSQELATLLNVIKTFDVDWLSGMSFALFPLEYVDAKTVASELGEIFGGAKSPVTGVVRFVPLARLNSLMVITPQAGYLKTVEEWIKRLDLGVTTPGRRIYVYDVQNGKADDLADSLNRILSLHSEDTAPPPAADIPKSALRQPEALADSPARAPGVAEDRSALDANALKIVPNAENNSLLILASPGEFSIVEAALKRIDVLPIQVLIEASIAEVALTDDLRYGLQWSYQGGDGPILLSEAAGGTINQRFPGFSYLYTGRADIRAVLNALETLTNVRVVSSPKLLVLNNRKAQLQIGDQVPIVVQSAVSTNDTNAPIVNSVQLHDTGVILRVTPRANKSGRVILEIDQEVSNVVPTTTSAIDSPTIQQRKMSSTVAVADGETIALGGLIRDARSRTRGGVPFLRRIPVIGDIFGSTNRNSARTELIVLIKPRVVRSQSESADVMNDLREQFRGLKPVMPQWQGAAAPSKEATDHEPPASEPLPTP